MYVILALNLKPLTVGYHVAEARCLPYINDWLRQPPVFFLINPEPETFLGGT